MRLLKIFRALFFEIDLFGREVKLSIKKKKVHRTIIGAMISVAILIFVASSFVSMIMDLYAMNDPNILNKIEFTPNPSVNYFQHYPIGL